MRVARARRASLAMTLLAVAVGAQAQQQGLFAYPNAGQNEAQQSRDKYECHQWAVSQTGFDPTTAPPLASAPPPGYAQQPGYAPPPPPQQQAGGGGLLGLGNGGMLPGSGMMGDAATGAALGAAGGALAGNAGKGAAIGAVASTLLGAMSRGSNSAPAPAQPQQASGGGLLGLGNGGMLPGSGMMGDAATGAALGAAGGALAGNAGKGAAIGAVGSTLLGAMSRGSSAPAAQPQQVQQQQYYAQQQQAEYNQRMQATQAYNGAFVACMRGRNYTVN